jgi:predicted phage terminase large subunit-like protein
MSEYRHYASLLEKGHIQMAVGPYLEKTQAEMGLLSCYVESMPAGRRDKQARARSIQGRMEEGRVYFPVDAAARFEIDDMVMEMVTFPYGANDDIVDALAWIGVYLTEMVPQGLAPTAARLPSWRDKLSAYIKRYDPEVPHKTSMSA